MDDRWLTVGSANLNEHSLFNDSEVNVSLRDERIVGDTRLRLWSEHLELPIDEIAGDPAGEINDRYWEPIAEEQLERLKSGLCHLTHAAVKLPGSRSDTAGSSGLSRDGSTTRRRSASETERLAPEACRSTRGRGAPARTASSWAATAAPKKIAIAERSVQSWSATRPARDSVRLAERRAQAERNPRMRG